MSAKMAYRFVVGLLGLALSAPAVARAVEKPHEMSKECVTPEAHKAIAACPGRPDKFKIGEKRGVAFKSAPPPREVKARNDTAKPRDASTLQQFAERDTRKTRLKARARALLITEIQGLERLYKQTPKRIRTGRS